MRWFAPWIEQLHRSVSRDGDVAEPRATSESESAVVPHDAARGVSPSPAPGIRARGMHLVSRAYGNQHVQRLVVATVRGQGQPLESDTRRKMESAFREDFTNVRIHTSPAVERNTRELGARAFTHGHDIFFDANTYDPESEEGRHLLAHELAHVLQQRDGAPDRAGLVDDSFEREAESVADAATHSRAVSVTQRGAPNVQCFVPQPRARQPVVPSPQPQAQPAPQAQPTPAPPADRIRIDLTNTPAINRAFRSIANDPFRYERVLVGIYLEAPDQRWSWIVNWFANEFPDAWADLLAQYPTLRSQPAGHVGR